MKKTLTLHVKGEYFAEIKAGTKTEEYRLFSDYWVKRIGKNKFDSICICLGYPKRDDTERRLIFPWRGYDIKTIVHKHFDGVPTAVFAIFLEHSIEVGPFYINFPAPGK